MTEFQRALADVQAVSGHVRMLQPGQVASEAAAAAAREAGIVLPEGYTWVRPHGRGGASVVHVRWPDHMRLW